MTLEEIITKAKVVGNQFSSFELPIRRKGLDIEFDFEISGNDTEGWHVEIVNYVEKGRGPKMDKAKRHSQLVQIAEKTTGYSYYKKRCFENTLIKGLVANQLRKDGLSYSEIGRFMGVHHSTVMFYVKRLQEMQSLPSAYKKELEMYEKFKTIVENTFV